MLCGEGAGGTICQLVSHYALIAQTEGLGFWPPHSHSFLLICSLHYCNYCSGLGFAGNIRGFPLPILCGEGAGGTICKLVPLCALNTQTESLLFWPPHSHNLLLICSLHYCNYCYGLGFAGNIRGFPLPILCGEGAGGTICKLVPLCALIAQTEGFRFWPLHSHSFMLMYRLH